MKEYLRLRQMADAVGDLRRIFALVGGMSGSVALHASLLGKGVLFFVGG